jgi:hypothetical protein
MIGLRWRIICAWQNCCLTCLVHPLHGTYVDPEAIQAHEDR